MDRDEVLVMLKSKREEMIRSGYGTRGFTERQINEIIAVLEGTHTEVEGESKESIVGFHTLTDLNTGVIYEYKIEESRSIPNYFFGVVYLDRKRHTIVTIDGKWPEYYGRSDIPETHPSISLLMDFIEKRFEEE